ncbi:MAG: hypothetical protein KZQ60_13760 [Candidatus Thiodiazotropha sp. (ex Lucinoma aequizonata)]|nr:hypothetical protein [Candidatus Thiodiazotropha sp. (ex Lucinoma aequizonata)]
MNEANVRLWRRNKDRLLKMPKTKQAERGAKAQFPEIEQHLLEWVTDRRHQGIAVSTMEARLQARLIAQKRHTTNFGGSVSWVYAFMRRNGLSVRRRTHIAQKLPEDNEEKLIQFQRYIIRARNDFNYELSQIGNADQTPLTFDLPYASSINAKGAKTVTINTTGNEKNRFTVMLACTADGGKLPPYVIFKRKTLPKNMTWPEGIVVRCQAKGWMDDALTRDWVKTVWGKRPGGFTKRSLLVLDSFRCHKSDDIKEILRNDHRTRLAIIPGGMTSVLQPLDVSVNKPMKVLLQRRWNDWYAGVDHSFTATGRMRKPELQDVCQWIVDAWTELDPAIIVRAFKKCCISNSMDGTEDDVIWQDFVQRRTSGDEDDDSQDVTAEEEFYEATPNTMTDNEFAQLFDSSDDEEEFEGFDEADLRFA